MDAIEFLRADHDRILALLDGLEHGPNKDSGANVEALRIRRDLVRRLVIALSQHEAVEELHFWPLVRGELPVGVELARHALGQEEAAKKVLDALRAAEPEQPEFEPLVAQAIAQARDHLDYEETEVWPQVQDTVDGARLVELGERMTEAKEMAPTRPHPGGPSNPGALTAAQRAAAAGEQLAATLRGQHRR